MCAIQSAFVLRSINQSWSRSSMVEQRPVEARDAGSVPAGTANGSEAKRVKRRALDADIESSSLSRPTKSLNAKRSSAETFNLVVAGSSPADDTSPVRLTVRPLGSQPGNASSIFARDTTLS
jgi:hypothetical protein